MDLDLIREKFGDEYAASEQTYIMGIDRRFTAHFAERFRKRRVLETCSGAGFTTIALATVAEHVFTVEIAKSHQDQAIRNVERAGLSAKVSFILGNIMDSEVQDQLPAFDSAFLDPDWAVSGPDHGFRFQNSNTRPPADQLLQSIFDLTANVALILPPLIDRRELRGLPEHEQESLYLSGSQELICLYFGDLIRKSGETAFRISD